jgi:hypothetical protein
LRIPQFLGDRVVNSFGGRGILDDEDSLFLEETDLVAVQSNYVELLQSRILK